MRQSNNFPQFRKYGNNKSYFKINSFIDAEEIQVIGRYYSITKLIANKMPDRNYISDLMNNTNGSWEVIDSDEYSLFLSHCLGNFSRLY
jgi:hypothetical protein